MALDPAAFKVRFPEFAGTSDPRVQAALDQAARRVDTRLHGDRSDDALGCLAAHLLAVSPFGRPAALDIRTDEGEATGRFSDPYLKEYKHLCRLAAGGPWAAGQRP